MFLGAVFHGSKGSVLDHVAIGIVGAFPDAGGVPDGGQMCLRDSQEPVEFDGHGASVNQGQDGLHAGAAQDVRIHLGDAQAAFPERNMLMLVYLLLILNN